MGLWGASQALAFGAGGILGTSLSDIARLLMETPAAAYAMVFGLEAILFIVAARLASQSKEGGPLPAAVPPITGATRDQVGSLPRQPRHTTQGAQS
jgi:BCD family chlorophyll transporter-like MFS transporter